MILLAITLLSILGATMLLGAYFLGHRWGKRIGADEAREQMFAPLKQRTRVYPLGFDSIEPIPPGEVCKIKQTAQVDFKGERIIVPDTIAEHFVIKALVIEGKNQLVSAGEIPCAVFSENAFGVGLAMDMGREIMMVVKNIDEDKSHRFLACLMGASIEIPPTSSKKKTWASKARTRL